MHLVSANHVTAPVSTACLVSCEARGTSAYQPVFATGHDIGQLHQGYVQNTDYCGMRLFQRVGPIFDGSTAKTSDTIQPMIVMSQSQAHQPVRSVSCRRRM